MPGHKKVEKDISLGQSHCLRTAYTQNELVNITGCCHGIELDPLRAPTFPVGLLHLGTNPGISIFLSLC